MAMSLLPLVLTHFLASSDLSKKSFNYFAFGSNMLQSTMESLRSVEPLGASAAVLPDYRLRFNIRQLPFVEPSAAAVEPCDGDVVHGVVYSLSQADFAKVGSTEGVPFSYMWRSCRVYHYLGDGANAGKLALETQQPILAWTLVATLPSEKDLPPSKSYLDILIEGAKNWKIDADYVGRLEKTKYATNLLVPNGLARSMLSFSKVRKARQKRR